MKRTYGELDADDVKFCKECSSMNWYENDECKDCSCEEFHQFDIDPEKVETMFKSEKDTIVNDYDLEDEDDAYNIELELD